MPDQQIAATAVARLSDDAAAARGISDALAESFDADAVSVSIFETADKGWSLALHFRNPPNETAVRTLVATIAGAAVGNALVFETLAPTDWVTTSLAGLKPVHAGRFTVHGAHDRARVGTNRLAIEIDAGLAFGTGHHGTTRGCLLALDHILKRRRIGDSNTRKAPVLDIGTGTGVLAIAAAKALRRRVVASDIDARAVKTARDNARLNRVGAFIIVVQAAAFGVRRLRAQMPYSLILANILLEPLRQMATPISRAVAPGGRVVLSGLLTEQAGPALAAYRARGLVLEHRIALEGWMTLVLVRPRLRGAAPRRAPIRA